MNPGFVTAGTAGSRRHVILQTSAVHACKPIANNTSRRT
jgi:hypothetical protein